MSYNVENDIRLNSMPRIEIEMHPVDDIITNATGRPGERTFYLQAIKGEQIVTLIVEKIQLQSLAVAVEQFLADIKQEDPAIADASSIYQEEEMLLKAPLEPLFHVGTFGLGYESSEDLIILVLREASMDSATSDDTNMLRVWCSRSQIRRLAHWSVELANRGRPICPLCGEIIGPEGHLCPKKNGHKKSHVISDGQAGNSE
jgi:uncharacterized repeat protein (TIGR03847 family)